jgi:hypothetical protein
MSGVILKEIFPQGRSKKMKSKLMAVIVLSLTCAATAFGQCYSTTAYGNTVAVPCPPTAPGADNAALASLMAKPQAWQAYAAGAEVARQRALAKAAAELAKKQTELAKAQTEAVRLQNQQKLQDLQRQQQQAVEAERQRQDDLQARWLEKLVEARRTHPEWDKVASSPEVQAEMIHPFLESAIMEMDNGPEVMYYLATHLAAYQKLETLTVFQGIGEVYRISDKLLASK